MFDIVELISQTVVRSSRFVNNQIWAFRLMRPPRDRLSFLALSREHKPDHWDLVPAVMTRVVFLVYSFASMRDRIVVRIAIEIRRGGPPT